MISLIEHPKGVHMIESKACFKRGDCSLEDMLTYIDFREIGLPDIQRPCV